MNFILEWNQELMSFYKHGSTVEFFDSNSVVHFKNDLLSPGATIVSWKSDPVYQADRTLLQLPLLEKGKKYEVSLVGKVFPKDSVLLKIEFFDRSGQLIENKLISRNKGEFVYPQNAFMYVFKLINSGNEELFFKHINIRLDNWGGDH